MISYQKGDLLLMDFPFAAGAKSKRRPTMVILTLATRMLERMNKEVMEYSRVMPALLTPNPPDVRVDVAMNPQSAIRNPQSLSRRQVLRSAVGGSLLLPGILSQLLADAGDRKPAPAPIRSRPSSRTSRPRRSASSSCSRPAACRTWTRSTTSRKLFKADGKMLGVGGGLSLEKRPLLKPRWEFKPGGKCGTLVSDLFPHLREQMDDICLIRSMTTDNNEHYQATLAIHTGSFFVARPSLGSWVSYGLGTVNQNLPSFVVIAPHLPYAGTQVWANDFLPAYHQGTRVVPGAEPIPNVKRQPATADLQELELGLAGALQPRAPASATATTRSWPPASARSRRRSSMQFEAPEAFDLSKETDETLELYGLKRGEHRRASPGSAWSPGGWPSAACGSSS